MELLQPLCDHLSKIPYLAEIKSNPYVQRFSADWKVVLMDTATVLAVAGVVITFFYSSALVCTVFVFFAASSAVAAFYMRQISDLTDLANTAQDLKKTRARLEHVAADLERENTRLAQTNRDLQQTNQAFQATNRNLQETNNRLTAQVAQLTLQVTQLRETAERIKTEMQTFQRENGHLHNNIRGFDASLNILNQQIAGSRALCDQIAGHLNAQQQGLGPQLEQLGRYLAELRQENRVHERIRELGALQQQVLQASQQLGTLRQEFAQERGHFEAIRLALGQLRGQFDSTLRDNNQQFRDNVDRLKNEITRVQGMLQRSAV